VLPNLLGVVGRVHQVVQVGRPLGGQVMRQLVVVSIEAVLV